MHWTYSAIKLTWLSPPVHTSNATSNKHWYSCAVSSNHSAWYCSGSSQTLKSFNTMSHVSLCIHLLLYGKGKFALRPQETHTCWGWPGFCSASRSSIGEQCIRGCLIYDAGMTFILGWRVISYRVYMYIVWQSLLFQDDLQFHIVWWNLRIC